MKGSQPSFTDAEYSQRRRVTRREEFLTMMDQVIPWDEWTGLIEPVYCNKKRGRRPVPVETMLRMYESNRVQWRVFAAGSGDVGCSQQVIGGRRVDMMIYSALRID